VIHLRCTHPPSTPYKPLLLQLCFSFPCYHLVLQSISLCWRSYGIALTVWSPRRGHARGGVAGPCALTDKVPQERWHEHRWGGGNALDEVPAAMAHPSGGSTVRGERRRWRRGGSRRRWAPVSGGIGLGSCSTGEDRKGETRPKLRGEGGRWPSSPMMEDDGGDGGVWWGPEPLSHSRWT
jgi:hypothetical protein